MVMNFWEAQRKAKTNTVIYLTVFIILTLTASTLAELAMRIFAADSYDNPDFPFVGFGFLAVTFGVAGFNYMNFLQAGGSYVAESVGAELVELSTRNPKEKQLLNIVEEIAIATSLPIPFVYILEADEINAFAAGTSPENAAITVTTGCLNLLNRDELQGVLAHEFGHIYHRDMRIGMRVAAMITGFFIVTYLGLRLLGSSSYSRRDEDRKDGNPVAIIALIFLIAGSVTWFFGSILQAMVSRQREYLADASAVQYTRNPTGIANALRKIGSYKVSDMPKSGKPFAHLYFNEPPSLWSRIFATHPPLEDRIAAIESGEYETIESVFPSHEQKSHSPPPPPFSNPNPY